MKLPWQKDTSDNAAAPEAAATPATPQPETKLPKGYTPPKGRPTPKRADQEIAKGVRRDPNGMSDAQRYQHRKELKASMSKKEWKAYKKEEREKSRERQRITQERMAAGDERYLMARDKGPERAFARDWVDSRRFLSEWAMPAALVMLFVMFISTVAPTIANITSIIAMVFIAAFAIEGIWMARKCNNAVRRNFPGSTAPGFSLGTYVFGRATQPRRWRTPRPRVERGADIN